MPKFYHRVKSIALPPGTLVSNDKTGVTRIRIIDYNKDAFQEKEMKSIQECYSFRDSPTVSWINIDGQDINIIQKIDEHFGIHPLVLEDIVDLGQRPKLEEYDDYLFLILKMIYFDEKIKDIYAEQIGIVLGRNFVLSFQEKEGDVFDPIRQRLRESKGRVRQMGTDYLAYVLLDAIVDHYFIVMERIGEKIDQLENKLLNDSDGNTPKVIHKLKTQIIFLKKHIWPLREVLASLQRSETKLIQKTTQIYIRDVYDHTIQVNDTLEAFRDSLSGMHDIYLSSVSNKMNEVMKVLTIFAAIFIPLTFIVGIYGMNFENMPELKWPYAYFVVLGIMAMISMCMLFYFRRKKWL
jgi:magnesium transporter